MIDVKTFIMGVGLGSCPLPPFPSPSLICIVCNRHQSTFVVSQNVPLKKDIGKDFANFW